MSARRIAIGVLKLAQRQGNAVEPPTELTRIEGRLDSDGRVHRLGDLRLNTPFGAVEGAAAHRRRSAVPAAGRGAPVREPGWQELRSARHGRRAVGAIQHQRRRRCHERAGSGERRCHAFSCRARRAHPGTGDAHRSVSVRFRRAPCFLDGQRETYAPWRQKNSPWTARSTSPTARRDPPTGSACHCAH